VQILNRSAGLASLIHPGDLALTVEEAFQVLDSESEIASQQTTKIGAAKTSSSTSTDSGLSIPDLNDSYQTSFSKVGNFVLIEKKKKITPSKSFSSKYCILQCSIWIHLDEDKKVPLTVMMMIVSMLLMKNRGHWKTYHDTTNLTQLLAQPKQKHTKKTINYILDSSSLM